MSVTLTVDPADDCIVHIKYTHDGSIPRSVAPVRFRMFWRKRKDEREELKDFKLFMVTRRSVANPGEVVKMRLELSTAITEYPAGSSMTVFFSSSGETYNAIGLALGDLADELRSHPRD